MGGYEYGLHYRRYDRDVNYPADIRMDDEQTTTETTLSNNTYLYLTYTGLLRVLFVSRNKNATRFTSWAVKQLFTVHLGTIPNKIEMASKLLHVGINDCIAVYKKYSQKFPCIYLLSLGKVGDLKSHFGITDETLADDVIIYKYGRTDNIQARLTQHKGKDGYGKIKNCNLDLVVYNYIDTDYLPKAEVEISKLCDSHGVRLNVEGHRELMTLSSEQLTQFKNQYELIGYKFSSSNMDLQIQKSKLDTEIVELKLKHQLELQEQSSRLKDENTKLNEEHYREIIKLKDENTRLKEDHYQTVLKMKDDHYADLKQMMEMMRPRA
jgi:hypothetical protein